MALAIKNLPAMRKTWVRPLGWEDPLEEGMETHSSILSIFSLSGFSCLCVCVCVCARAHTLSHVQLCDSKDCSPPDSSVHGIFQARILKWVVISSSRGSSLLRNQTCDSRFSRIDGRFCTTAPPGKPSLAPGVTFLSSLHLGLPSPPFCCT